MSNADFLEAFDKYFAGCEAIYNAYHKANGWSDINKNEYEYSVGKRYIKVIYKTGSQRSVHSFVDMKMGVSFGDVLKPAGWNAPAKGARGNIFDKDNGLGRMGAHGPAYNR